MNKEQLDILSQILAEREEYNNFSQRIITYLAGLNSGHVGCSGRVEVSMKIDDYVLLN